jgi:hypothetical protein
LHYGAAPPESQEARFVENVDLDQIEQSSPRSIVRAIDLLTGKALRGFGLTVARACTDLGESLTLAAS